MLVAPEAPHYGVAPLLRRGCFMVSMRRRATGFLAAALIVASTLGVAVITASPASADTLTVSNGNDSGPGSLRQAAIDAEGTAGPDTIEIQPGVGTITL